MLDAKEKTKGWSHSGGAASLTLVLDKPFEITDGTKLTLTIERGELRCIIGPNGAGKTTMMDVITGKTRPDTGTVRFAD